MSDTPGAIDTSAANRLREQLARLAEKFLVRTRDQALMLHEFIERLQAGDSTAIAPMHAIAHKIHGSGAMFNFPSLSERAAEIERLSDRLLKSGPSIDLAANSQILQHLAISIEQLTQAVETVQAARS